MSAAHPDETAEWMAGRIESWVETYKKAMLAPVVLRLVALHQPVTVATLTELLVAATGWQITERGLYRTVKRLQDSGFLAGANIDAPRTGAKRKELTLSPLGDRFLSGVEASIVGLPTNGASAG